MGACEQAARAAIAAARKHQGELEGERKGLTAQFEAMKPVAWLRAADSTTLDGAPETLRAIVTRVFAIRAEQGTADPDATAKTEQWVSAMQAAVVVEKACRVDKKCMAKRAAEEAEAKFLTDVVNPLCAADSSREEARAAIAREKANPGGVVDVTLLHDLGITIQNAEDEMKPLRPRYLAVRHHPFTGWRSECKTQTEPQ